MKTTRKRYGAGSPPPFDLDAVPLALDQPLVLLLRIGAGNG